MAPYVLLSLFFGDLDQLIPDAVVIVILGVGVAMWSDTMQRQKETKNSVVVVRCLDGGRTASLPDAPVVVQNLNVVGIEPTTPRV